MAILVHNPGQNYIKQISDSAKEFTFRICGVHTDKVNVWVNSSFLSQLTFWPVESLGQSTCLCACIVCPYCLSVLFVRIVCPYCLSRCLFAPHPLPGANKRTKVLNLGF